MFRSFFETRSILIKSFLSKIEIPVRDFFEILKFEIFDTRLIMSLLPRTLYGYELIVVIFEKFIKIDREKNSKLDREKNY